MVKDISTEVGPRRITTFSSGRSCLVTAAFDDLDDAKDAVEDLEREGHAREHVSIFMSTDTRDRHLRSHDRYGQLETNAIVVEGAELEEQRKTAEGAGAGGAVGGVLGAAGAALAAAGTTLVVPPLGIAVAGPVAAMLAGLGVGSVAGGVIGALVGAGMTEYRARRFDELLKDGRILVGVLVQDEADGGRVVEIFEEHDGTMVENEARTEPA